MKYRLQRLTVCVFALASCLTIAAINYDVSETSKRVNARTAELLSATLEPTPTPKRTYLGKYQIYGYVPTCLGCCGKTDGITASGVKATVGKTVAMKGIPFGTRIYIEGLGYFTVEDRGVGKGVVDVACANHKGCYAVTSRRDVYVVG